MQAGAAAVWIQVGIGIWMLAAPRGGWSRLAGLASVGWGLVVWVFGEAFGGVFAPGLTWLFGAPGAAATYVVAGALIALPERMWRDAGSGRPFCPGWACSWSPWRCCRPGRDADSGRGSPTGGGAPWPT